MRMPFKPGNGFVLPFTRSYSYLDQTHFVAVSLPPGDGVMRLRVLGECWGSGSCCPQQDQVVFTLVHQQAMERNNARVLMSSLQHIATEIWKACFFFINICLFQLPNGVKLQVPWLTLAVLYFIPFVTKIKFQEVRKVCSRISLKQSFWLLFVSNLAAKLVIILWHDLCRLLSRKVLSSLMQTSDVFCPCCPIYN